MTGQRCPLCRESDAPLFADLPPRRYFQCSRCALVFLDPAQRPSPQEERAEYDLHQNDPADVRYRRHLAKLTVPLADGLAPGVLGLDFGCGPGPAVSVMLGEQGFRVANYDPFYLPDASTLDRTYDFITCTEVAEHFHNPAEAFALLNGLLRPGGRLGIMTQMLLPHIEFPGWRYRLQPSHVVFYGPETMRWIAGHFAGHFEWVLDLRPPDVAIFTRG